MSWFYRRLLRFSLLVVLGVVLCVMGNLAMGQPATPAVAQSVPAGQLVQQGLANYRAGLFPAAIALWEQALAQVTNHSERAIIHTNLGQAYRQVGQFDLAISHWEKARQIYEGKYADNRAGESQRAIAQLLTEQAQAYGDLGQHQNAVSRLEKAIQLSQKHQDRLTEAAAQGALGNAYWSLGTYEAALPAHEQSLRLACSLNNAGYITTALNNLGNVLASRAGRYQFQATAAGLEGDVSSEKRLMNQANDDIRVALAAYQRSAEVSQHVSGLAEARALLNLNHLLVRQPQFQAVTMPELSCDTLNLAQVLRPAGSSPTATTTAPAGDRPTASNQASIARNRNRILALLTVEADSQEKAYSLINLANSLLLRDTTGSITGRPDQTDPTLPSPIALLEKALTVARNIGDGRTESFALGILGEVYEANGQADQAMTLTRQAQFKAQTVKAADSLYRWQWQVGRMLKAKGQTTQAIAAYEQAIATLQSIRGDIVVANRDLQFDFRDSVEPVYRQLIGLLLSDASGQENRQSATGETATEKLKTLPGADSVKTKNISKVLNILELLKLAELQNFFGDDCVQVARDAATAEQSLRPVADNEPNYGIVDSTAAVIYSVVLDDRSYMILRLPNGHLQKYPIELAAGSANKQLAVNSATTTSGKQLENQIDEFRGLLEKRATEEYLIASQAVYDALIRPMADDLAAARPATLVFINDGVLRKVPMAALHDGKQFLIEKYPIATTPSLSLTTRRPFARQNMQALILGLTVAQPPFAALPNVGTEVKGVQRILGGTELVDQAFTLNQMQQRLEKNNYSIIHMATHGKFGADAASTFLLAYQDRITINQLDEVLRRRGGNAPVELLTLSACQTAAGDNRSALGIAGVAVRAGVKSALATLWFINDEATVPLIEEFYKQLQQPDMTKAEALRQAQLKLITNREYNHPAVWSPFILIGNWL